jgi:hypothetical protein
MMNIEDTKKMVKFIKILLTTFTVNAISVCAEPVKFVSETLHYYKHVRVHTHTHMYMHMYVFILLLIVTYMI